jgi:PAS domain S-box-containing protein
MTSEKMRYREILRIFLLIIATLGLLTVHAAAAQDSPKIIILNSYHQGFAWSDAEQSGFLDRLREVYPEVDVPIQFLDAKRYPDQEYLTYMKDFLLSRYQGKRIDLIVAFDNPALDMLMNYPDELFPDIPVVFSGVSDVEQYALTGRKRVTGVAEIQDAKNTLESALVLHPRTREVLVLNDDTTSGVSSRRELEALIPSLDGRVRIQFLPPATFDEARARIASLPPDTLVLIHSFSTDRSGRNLSLSESTRLFTSDARVPVYALHESRLGHGIVGGHLLGGRAHGRRAADIALRILAGEDPDRIPVDMESTARPMFDYVQLKRFAISEKDLPAESIIINKPDSLFEKHRGLVIGTLSVMTILVVMVVFLTASIIRRKRAEEALRESEFLFKSQFDLGNIGIALSSVGNGWLRVNRKLCEMLGYSEEELRTKTWRELTFPDDIEVDEALYTRMLSGEIDSYEVDKRFVRKDGSLLYTHLSVSCYRGLNGTVRFVIVNVHDMSEHKQAEEEKEKLQLQLLQAQKMEAVGRLAGGVAHDFNNTLSVIIGYVELSQAKLNPSPPLARNLTQIFKAATKSADLTRQLLAFSRRQLIQPTVLDINHVIGDSEKMLRHMMGEDIDLQFIPQTDLWTVRMDSSQVDQILANLAVNARDAMPDGGKLTIRTANTPLDKASWNKPYTLDPGNYVMLAMSDTGCGMDKATTEHMFEPFFTTKGEGKGTGLGLSTVYGILKQNMGFINVYSEPGLGTTIRIYLPRHGGPAEATEEEEGMLPGTGNETILLVEDEEQILSLFKESLEEYGYRVLATARPEEALTFCEEHRGPIHLLITDVVMPSLNGKELGERIVKLKPEIKILYMSGYTTDIVTHRGILTDGVNFIQKPFQIRDLAIRIRDILEN